MVTHDERISFVVLFAEMDLANLRAGDLLNLQEEMLAFLEWPPSRRKELTLEALAPIQETIQSELRNIAEAVRASEAAANNPLTYEDIKRETLRLAKEGRSSGRTGLFPPGWAPALPGTPDFGLWHRGGVALNTIMLHPQSVETGYGFPLALIQSKVESYKHPDGTMHLRAIPPTLPDCFFLAFAVALNGFDLHRFRQCPSVALRAKRVCNRIFIAAQSNQEFCSAQCATRERTRRMRAAAREIATHQEPPSPHRKKTAA